MDKITVKMVTERKIIAVQPGVTFTSPDRIEVDVCVKCGAIVFDPFRHDAWHCATDHEDGAHDE